MSKESNQEEIYAPSIGRKYKKRKGKAKKRWIRLATLLVTLAISITFICITGWDQPANRTYSEALAAGKEYEKELDLNGELSPAAPIMNPLNSDSDTAISNNNVNVIKEASPEMLSFLENDILLQTDKSHDYYMYIPFMQYGEKNYLSLIFSHSDILLEKNSTFTVLMDDVPVWSQRLTKQNESYEKVTIPIPKKVLNKKGFHKISFAFYGSISDERCEDNTNPANWLTIHKESYVFLSSKDTITTDNMLQHFPYPFIKEGSKNPVQGSIVIPDGASNDIVEAAVNLSHYLLSKTERKKPVEILTESELSAQKALDKHLIVIGKKSDWNDKVKEMATNIPDSLKRDQLLIQNTTIGQGEKKLATFVTALSDAVIKEKISVLTNEEFIQQLSGNSLTITKTPELLDEEGNNVLDFEKLGINHITLTSDTNSSQNIFYTIPSHWELKGDITLHLSLKISPLLTSLTDNDGQTDSEIGLNVTVNNIPYTISIDELSKIKEQSGEGYVLYDLKIPMETVQKSQSLTISFSSNLIKNEADCMRIDDSTRWIFVNQNSSIDIPYEIAQSESFLHWPSPFVNDSDFENTIFIVPDEVTGDGLTQLAYFIDHMGMNVDAINNYQVMKENEVTIDQLKNSHIVILGTTKDIESMSFLKDVPINTSDLEKHGILQETTTHLSWVQPSYWNEQYSMLFVTRAGEPTDAKDLNTYYSHKMLDFLKGNDKNIDLIAMSQSEEIITAVINKKGNSIGGNSKPSSLKESYWLLVLILILFGAAIFVFLRMLRKRRGKIDE